MTAVRLPWLQAVQLLFACSAALLDASIAAWSGKYTYNTPRPITAELYLYANTEVCAASGMTTFLLALVMYWLALNSVRCIRRTGMHKKPIIETFLGYPITFVLHPKSSAGTMRCLCHAWSDV